MTQLINQLIFILINVLNAVKDGAKVKAKKDIDHFLNGVAYCLTICVFVMIFKMTWSEAIVFWLQSFVNRQLFFDLPLNFIRRLKWDYVSPDPESWVDKLEIKIFGKNGRLPVYIYASAFIVFIFINLNFDL